MVKSKTFLLYREKSMQKSNIGWKIFENELQKKSMKEVFTKAYSGGIEKVGP